MNLFVLKIFFAALISQPIFANANRPAARCALMLGKESADTQTTFLSQDNERAIGLYLPKPTAQDKTAGATLFWWGMSSPKNLSTFGQTMRDQHQDATESLKVHVNFKEILNVNSARHFTRFHEALYKMRRGHHRRGSQELQNYVLIPTETNMSPVVAWCERNDEEGVAPQVAVSLHARALFRPVVREAVRRLIHETATYPISDTLIDEAFSRVEAAAR